MNFLDAIQRFNCFSCMSRISKDWLPVERIGRNKHRGFILDRMALGHARNDHTPRPRRGAAEQRLNFRNFKFNKSTFTNLKYSIIS